MWATRSGCGGVLKPGGARSRGGGVCTGDRDGSTSRGGFASPGLTRTVGGNISASLAKVLRSESAVVC